MHENAEFYVYALFRPWNGVPCYVGKGKGSRWVRHEKLADRHNNDHLAAIFKKAGGPIPRVKIRENLTENEAFELEKSLIAVLGRHPNGVLANKTDGGDGVSGVIQSPETRKKRSESLKNHVVSNETREKIRQGHIGRKFTKERSEAMSKARTGRSLSLETRKKMSVSRKGFTLSPESRAKLSATKKGKAVHTEESKAKMSAHRKGRALSPETRAKMSASHKARLAAMFEKANA